MLDENKECSLGNDNNNTEEEFIRNTENNMPDCFGFLLRHYRVKVKNISLKQLEYSSKISSSYINRLERGEKNSPTLPVVFSLANCLDIPHSVLMATIFPRSDDKKQRSISDVLIQSHLTMNNKELSLEARSILVRINEFLVECEWTQNSKVKELYLLSEMLDEFKGKML